MGRGAFYLCILLAAFMLGAAKAPEPKSQPEQNQTAAQLNSSTTRIVEAINSIAAEKDAGCEGREDRRSSELCAQWKAADSAKRAAVATWFAVIFSFIGTVLVAATFWEQRKVARAELRAYVGVTAVGLLVSGTDGSAIAELKIANNGRTPAFNTRWAGNIVIRAERQMELDLIATQAANIYPQGRHTSLSIHGGQSAIAVLQGNPNLDLREYQKAAAGGDCNLYVFGTAWYEDAFGNNRYTNFCFQAETLISLDGPKKNRREEGTWSMTPFHNDSD